MKIPHYPPKYISNQKNNQKYYKKMRSWGTASKKHYFFSGLGIYASGIAGLSFLKKNIEKLKGKKLIVFCCGASPFDQEAYEAVVAHNMKGALEGIPCFYCRGAWNEDEMTFKDRTLCRMLQKAVAKQDPKEYEPWQKALMCAAGQKCDWTDRAYLDPLLDYIGISH